VGKFCLRCFLLGKGDALAINFQLCFRICNYRVQVKQVGLKLNGTHQFLAYADDVNIIGGSAHTVR
jgi:hypothetical protein